MGDNIYLGDRNGVRTPMQWSGDRNAGFSRANPQRLYLPRDHRPRVPLRGGQRRGPGADNPPSLLWWMKRLIALRKQLPGLRPRHARVPHPDNRKVLAYVRATGRAVLVVANLSRFAQSSSSTCREFAGRRRSSCSAGRVPLVRGEPYLLTLGPHVLLVPAQQAPRGEDTGGC